jgi:hypothetical protein
MHASIDKWFGNRCVEENFESVTLADGIALINLLDQKSRTLLTFKGSLQNVLMIGGGQGSYVLTYEDSAHQNYIFIASRDSKNNVVEVNAGGQFGEYSCRNIASKKQASEVLESFIVGHFDTSMWEEIT